MTEKTVMDALVLMKRTGNLLNDLEDLTRQLAQSIDRNDQVSIQMLIAMREEPLAKLQTADRALREQLEALPDRAEAGPWRRCSTVRRRSRGSGRSRCFRSRLQPTAAA